MKIALVHDYLLEAGGAERVLRVLSDMYPKAPIYTALTKNGSARQLFGDRKIVESPWAWFLKIGRFYSYFRFFLPWVWKSIDLSHYDLVITSCSGYIARGFKVGSKTTVVAYCHTPPRWLYGYDTPTGAHKSSWGQTFMWLVGPFMRYFDYHSARRVDIWVANSKEVARRIEKFYRQRAVVVYPPIEFTNIPMNQYTNEKKENYYLIVSRVVGSKGILAAARAAQQGNFTLKIAGEIIDRELGKRLANMGEAVTCLGRVDEEALSRLYTQARGFMALSLDEDFGMTVVESMTYGTPVLAYRGGGYLETVIPGKTGVFVEGLTTQEIGQGIASMEKTKWDPELIRKWASKFGRGRFEREIRRIVDNTKHTMV